MASPPHEEEEEHHQQQQSEIGGSPPTVTVTSPVEEDQEFIDSNMPYSPSLNSVDCQLTEYPVDQPPPPPPPPEVPQVVEIPPSPPPAATEQTHEIKEPPLEQQPSPPSSVHEDPPENPNPNPNVDSPTENPPPSTAEAPPEKPISKPSSPSPLTPPPEKSTDFDTNPKGESPVAQQVLSPPSEIEDNNNESLSLVEVENNPKPSSRSPSPKSPHKELPLGVPLYNAVTNFIPSKPVISPWTHDETANLIQAYQEKWYSIKKGPLKAGQWEEVAVTVAARCGYDEPTKTSKQCRHKMEKLRKRYRQERGKPRSRANAWDFFKMMDNLEKGPLPISSSPMEVVEYGKPSDVNGKKRKSDVVGGEFLVSKRSARVRNSNSNDRGNVNGGLVGTLPFSDGVSRIVKGLRTPVVHKPREYYQASYGVQKKVEEEDDDGGSDNDGDEGVVTQLAAEIKGFAEKFVRMEKNKIEMIRDVERYRMEMENKRMEMIRESQQMLVETVNRAFGASNKTHRLSAK